MSAPDTKAVSATCGGLAALTGLCGLIGWLLHLPVLIQLRSDYAAMQFNTALGLLAAGVALLLLPVRPKLAGICGIGVAILGALTLIEYQFRVDLGIDQALYHPWLMAEVPGRMAVNTALCFFVAGVFLASASLASRFRRMSALWGGYLLIILSGSALTGYAMEIEIAYRWAYQTRMAVPTAVGFLILGAGMCNFGWQRTKLNKTFWLTLMTGGGVASVSTLTWFAVASEYRRLSAPPIVPDMMLLIGITRACIAAICLFLWRNNRERLSRAENLNTDLTGQMMESAAQLQAIFRGVQIGTWQHQLGSKRAVFRGRTGEIFGFPQEEGEFEFPEILDRIHPEDRPGFLEAGRTATERTGTVAAEFRVIRPDSSVRWVLLQGGVSEYRNGKATAMSGINFDITRLKEAELALQEREAAVRKLNLMLDRLVRVQSRELVESEKRFRLMVEGLRDYAFFMLDTTGNVVSWNLGAERIFGYTAEEVFSKPLSTFLSAADPQRDYFPEAMQLAASRGSFEETGWRVRKDGTRLWAQVSLTPIYDETEALCGFSMLTRDVTERKLALEQIEEQRKKADESNHAKSRFLATMSHEIRTPMNAILGMSDLLSETQLDEDQRHYVEIFRRAGASLLDLINNILDLSKIESGRLELEKIRFDPAEVIHSVVDLLTPKAREKGIGLRARIEPKLSRCLTGDPARLRQVLINLAGNAIKFTSSGEVVISAEHPEGCGAQEICFSVTDTGIGIPADRLSSIFEDFTQADISTAREYGGTGLGLPISQRLVERMGGVLKVHSEPRRGSSFYFIVGFEAASAAPAPPPDRTRVGTKAERTQTALPEIESTARIRLLVAEDSEDSQEVLRGYLKSAGYELSVVSDGHSAVQKVEQGVFDAILMDLEMPGMNGLEATRAIRALERTCGRQPAPILALSAHTQKDAIDAAKAAGCNGHLSKPVSRSALFRLLSESLHPVPVGVNATPASKPAAVVDKNLPRYLSARRKELPEIVALLAASHYDKIRSLGHNMKGTGNSHGFPGITEIGAAIERFAGSEDREALNQQLLRLANYLESVNVQEEAATPIR